MNNNFVSENSPTPADLLSEAIKKGNYFSAVDGEYPDNHIMVFCNFGIVTGRVEDRVVVLYLQPEKEDEWLPLPETSSWKREIHRGIELIVTKIKYEDLGFYLEDGTFIAEHGDFDIYIGENCYAEKRFKISLN